MVRYVHVTDTPLNLDNPSVYPQHKLVRYGKPIGLWYAPDTAWIDRETKESRNYLYKYEFPLEGKFVEDIEAPSLKTIFRLNATNIEAFEAKVQSFLKNPSTERKVAHYLITLDNDLTKLLTPEQQAKVNALPSSSKQYKEKKALIGADINTFIKTGTTANSKVSDAVRLIDYGAFLRDSMKPMWGGIDYDASLFTNQLKARYPFIEKVEIPSGCLWHPTIVMKDYEPTPVQGGKRGTRRKKFRKSTRRRKQ